MEPMTISWITTLIVVLIMAATKVLSYLLSPRVPLLSGQKREGPLQPADRELRHIMMDIDRDCDIVDPDLKTFPTVADIEERAIKRQFQEKLNRIRDAPKFGRVVHDLRHRRKKD